MIFGESIVVKKIVICAILFSTSMSAFAGLTPLENEYLKKRNTLSFRMANAGIVLMICQDVGVIAGRASAARAAGLPLEGFMKIVAVETPIQTEVVNEVFISPETSPAQAHSYHLDFCARVLSSKGSSAPWY
jgi:hypothetical protein